MDKNDNVLCCTTSRTVFTYLQRYAFIDHSATLPRLRSDISLRSVDSRDCAIITWKGVGGHKGNHNWRGGGGGLDVKFNTHRGGGRGALPFSLFFKNWKSGRKLVRV